MRILGIDIMHHNTFLECVEQAYDNGLKDGLHSYDDGYDDGVEDGKREERSKNRRNGQILDKNKKKWDKNQPITDEQKEELMEIIYRDEELDSEWYEPIVAMMNQLEAHKEILKIKGKSRIGRHRRRNTLDYW